MAAILRGFGVLAPTARRVGLFEDAQPGDVLSPEERLVLQVAEVDVGGRLSFVGQVVSPTVAPEDVEAAWRSLAGGSHSVVLTRFGEHPMWKNADMPARLAYRGASPTSIEDAACSVALVLACWGWDEREIIAVTVDGERVSVRMTFAGDWRCEPVRRPDSGLE